MEGRYWRGAPRGAERSFGGREGWYEGTHKRGASEGLLVHVANGVELGGREEEGRHFFPLSYAHSATCHAQSAGRPSTTDAHSRAPSARAARSMRSVANEGDRMDLDPPDSAPASGDSVGTTHVSLRPGADARSDLADAYMQGADDARSDTHEVN